jgi:hypothetical protein
MEVLKAEQFGRTSALYACGDGKTALFPLLLALRRVCLIAAFSRIPGYVGCEYQHRRVVVVQLSTD